MNITAALSVAMTALRINALRSFLASLGVVIGVGAVITTISMAEGSRQAVREQINSMGANVLMLRPGSADRGGRRGGAGTSRFFSDADVEALRAVPSVAGASGIIYSNGIPAVSEFDNWTTNVQGVHADYFEIRDWPLAEGAAFTGADLERGARVVVLGQTAAGELFPQGGAVGATVRMNNVPMTVLGVLSVRGQSSWGQDQDDVIFVPVTTLRDRITGMSWPGVRDPVFMIWIEVAAGARMSWAEQDIAELMRVRRELPPGSEDNFSLRNMADTIEARNETERVLSFSLAAMGSISLLVGGIGIMNIMLVSVTERTREIGLRLAVGARRSDVRFQFLLEAIALCLVGGLLGMGAGIGAAMALERLADIQMGVSALSAVVAVAASAGVGVVFGFYPALRASRLDPIEALRHE